jgi:hypothetical protein
MAFSLIVEYKGLPEFPQRGHKTLDGQIEAAARKQSEGSGYGFGVRDLEFCYAKKATAENAKARVQQLAKSLHKRIRCTVQETETED